MYRLKSLLDETKTIYEKFGRKDITREHIAQVFGQKASSGGLSQKIADMKSFGLLSGVQGRFSVTNIGVNATFGSSSAERAEALDKAVKNVPLWVEIYKKCGLDPEPDTFWVELVEITGIERPESQTKAESVRKAYIEDARYLLPVNASKEPEKPDIPDSPSNTGARVIGVNPMPTTPTATQPAGGFRPIQFQIGDSGVTITDKISLDLIYDMLSNLKKSLDTQAKLNNIQREDNLAPEANEEENSES